MSPKICGECGAEVLALVQHSKVCVNCDKRHKLRPARVLEILQDKEPRTLTEIHSLFVTRFQDDAKITIGSISDSLTKLLNEHQIQREHNVYHIKE
jgi:hypothetical protein